MKIGNRYEVIKELGKGGMANVYLAIDTILNREVAIKVLKGDMSDDPISLERFRREANASTKLSHPNVVDVYDVGEDGDKHYIVMEYVKGFTLKQLIRRRGAIAPKEAVWLMKQLTAAVLEAHKNGIIHRDIKSQNVLIKDDGTVKMADFGIAQLSNSLQLTSTNSVLGSVHYLAPELSKGASATMQSDIYSLGIVFYEILTGDVPFKADTPVQVALLHIKNNVPNVRDFNSEIPQSVDNIIKKATAHDLKDRYANVALMLKDLLVCLDPEHKDDKAIEFSLPKQDTANVSKASTARSKLKEINNEKTTDRLSVVFIVLISLISIIAVIGILLLSGVIGGSNNQFVEVPEISGMTIAEARDYLADYSLDIDDSDIEWILTSDVPENQIVKTSPEPHTEVEKGYKIKLTVSEGNYAVMANYVGQKLDDVRLKLQQAKIKIVEQETESEEEPGTILSQSGLTEGMEYNPYIENTVTFTYSAYPSQMIPYDIIGMDRYTAQSQLNGFGFKVEFEQLSFDKLSSEEQAISAGLVVRVDPDIGTLYTQKQDSKIILYYY